MTNTKVIGGIAVLAVILSIFGLVGGNQPEQASLNLSGLTNYDEIGTTDGYEVDNSQVIDGSGNWVGTGTVKFGSNGTTLTAIKTGSCTIWAPATTIAASTTQQIVCQSATDGSIGSITGVTADSICQIINASSTNTTSNSIVVAGSSASSTAGTIVGRLSNLTGGTFTWTAAASSSAQWNYSCFDPS